jgi:Rha family phage regulatory protein
MKNAHPVPKKEAGAPGKGAAIVTRPAKSDNSASEPADLVTVEHGQPMTDSLLVAVEFGKRHDNVLRDIDALQADLSPEFWRLNFEERDYTDRRGKVQRMFRLTQAGFTALVMGFTGKKAVSLRERFIVAFQRVTAELQRLKAMQSAPSWQAARVETKRDFCNVADMLQEVRADAGKETGRIHHMNEAKLIRFALTGSETAKWDRDTLSRDDLKLLGKVERLDMRLIARGMPFHDRKASCRALVLEARGLLLKGAA